MNDIYFLLIAFLGSIFSGIIGFGAGLFLIPLGSLFLPFKEAIALCTALFIFLNLSKLFFFRKTIEWNKAFYFTVGALPLTLTGSFLMVKIKSEYLIKTFGLLLLIYVFYKLRKSKKKKVVPWKFGNIGFIIGGGLYGFLGGIVGMGNVIKATVFGHLMTQKEKFVGTLAAVSLLVNITKITVYSRYELIGFDKILIISGLFFCAFIGVYIGKYFLKKICPLIFEKIILVFIGLMALKMLIF